KSFVPEVANTHRLQLRLKFPGLMRCVTMPAKIRIIVPGLRVSAFTRASEDYAMNNDSKTNFTDALAMNVRYAILTKKGRLEILVKPNAKQLRKRGKKGWHLFRI